MSDIKIKQEQINKIMDGAEMIVRTDFGKCTVVTVKLPNGFILTESSACVDPENYDEALGVKICMEHIMNRLWELEGYKLQSRVASGEPVANNCSISPERAGAILRRAVDTFGKTPQVIVAIEELSELQRALCKYLRNRRLHQGDMDEIMANVREEMADVHIMLEQLGIIFGSVEAEEEKKLLRLDKLVDDTIKENAITGER